MVNDRVPNAAVLAIEPRREDLLGNRHPDGIRQSLSERTGRRLDPGRITILGVPRRTGLPLAEVPQGLHRHVVDRQMQQRVEQHRAVAVRQYKPVTIRPFGIGRVVAQIVAPEDLGNIGHPHWGAGVTRPGLLDCVHAECADCVC